MSKTIKVRIAVAVTACGDWAANGWSGDNGKAITDAAEEAAFCGLDDKPKAPYIVHWVIAEVPIPEPQEIEGKVEP